MRSRTFHAYPAPGFPAFPDHDHQLLPLLRRRLDFEESAFLNHDPLLWARIMDAAVCFTSIVIYTVITFVRLRDFRKNIRNKFSFETDKNHLFWLNYLALLFTADTSSSTSSSVPSMPSASER
jgi:hypothetical protein